MNKTVKNYFIRYTLEFFVIVLGISFSFLVQNIREETELDSKRELIFKSLLNELESNQSYITSRKKAFVREMDYVSKFLKDSLTKNKIKEYPENLSPLNPFLSALTFSPSASIYNSLINDGSFNLIDSPTLKSLIDEVYTTNYKSIVDRIQSELKIANEAERFFATNYSKIYSKNFWFNVKDAKLNNSVFEIMKNNYRFKAFMVQKISYMEVKIISMNRYIRKRNSLIKLLKKHITDENQIN
ncbi:MAG: hypothetical protein P8Q53_02610 [Flavobacteriaceae bacterium]|nr:hypothetical protein [Flavobacteriaceae bacterium]